MPHEAPSPHDHVSEHFEKMEEIEFFKTCKLTEDNHIHHAYDDVVNPEAHHAPHRYVSVTEIFFDLVFVGVAGNLAHGLRLDELTYTGYFQYMTILLTFWKDYTWNQSLFAVDDFVDKCSAFFYGLGIVGCACTSFQGPLGHNGQHFGINVVYISVVQFILNLRGYYGLCAAIKDPNTPSYREKSTLLNMELQLFKTIGMIVLWLVFSFGGREFLIWINLFAPIIFDFFIAGYFTDVRRHFHPNVHHFNERFEAIALICLGETVLSIIPDLEKAEEENCMWRTIGCIIMCYVNMFLYKIFHFDVEENEGKHHAIYQGGLRKCIWTYASIVECIGIVLFGGSMGELIKGVMTINSMEAIHKSNTMMAVGMSVALAANMIVRFSHKPDLESFKYSKMVYVAQNVFQLICICVIAPLRHLFTEKLLRYHPWVRSLYVGIWLFILNAFFFVDEILEYRHLKTLVKKEENSDMKSVEMVVKIPDAKKIPPGEEDAVTVESYTDFSGKEEGV